MVTRMSKITSIGKITPGGKITPDTRKIQSRGFCMEIRKVTPGGMITKGGKIDQVTLMSIQTQNTRRIKMVTWRRILRTAVFG